MLSPARKDYELYLGASFFDRFVWWNKSTDSPYDLTDAEIRMQVRPKIDSSTVLMNLNTDNGMIVIDDAKNGSFYFHVPFQTTESIDSEYLRSAVYDLEVEIQGYVFTILTGKIKFLRQATR